MNQHENEKKESTETAQNEQAPQDENPLSSPEIASTDKATKTLNDPLERKRNEAESKKEHHD